MAEQEQGVHMCHLNLCNHNYVQVTKCKCMGAKSNAWLLCHVHHVEACAWKRIQGVWTFEWTRGLSRDQRLLRHTWHVSAIAENTCKRMFAKECTWNPWCTHVCMCLHDYRSLSTWEQTEAYLCIIVATKMYFSSKGILKKIKKINFTSLNTE